jgi:hypothetical protein
MRRTRLNICARCAPGAAAAYETSSRGAQEKVLRRNVDAEGAVHVVRGVCLSDFIQASAAAHRALRRPG